MGYLFSERIRSLVIRELSILGNHISHQIGNPIELNQITGASSVQQKLTKYRFVQAKPSLEPTTPIDTIGTLYEKSVEGHDDVGETPQTALDKIRISYSEEVADEDESSDSVIPINNTSRTLNADKEGNVDGGDIVEFNDLAKNINLNIASTEKKTSKLGKRQRSFEINPVSVEAKKNRPPLTRESSFSISTQCDKFLVFLKKNYTKKFFSKRELFYQMNQNGIVGMREDVLRILNQSGHFLKISNDQYKLL